MRVLLDTHAFLWGITADPRLSLVARQIFEEQELVLSVASVWEIVTKVAIGKLPLPAKVSEFLPSQIAINGIAVLPIHARHVLRLDALPLYHRDPFDRLLVAQSLEEDLPIVTSDPLLQLYGPAILW